MTASTTSDAAAGRARDAVGLVPASRHSRAAFGRTGDSAGKASGFTLIELMITIAVVAIVMTIAVTSYGFATVKTHRSAAKGCLMEAAQFMERHYTTTMAYTGTAYPELACNIELEDAYDFGFDGTPDATTFALQAIPIGSQASDDTLCGTLKIDSIGSREPTTEGCW